MLKVPVWLVHPGVCPVSANVPEPEPMPIAMVPCMVMVFVAVLPDGIQEIVIVIVPPFVIPGPISPLITVPAPKHWASEPMLAKFMPLPFSAMPFWIMLKVNEPNCWFMELESVSDHSPVAGFVVLVVEDVVVPPQAIKAATKTIAANTLACFILPPSDQSDRMNG